MAKKLKLFSNPYFRWLLIISCCVLLLFCVSYSAYYYLIKKTNSSYTDEMYKHKITINKANSSAASAIRSANLNSLSDKDVTNLKAAFTSSQNILGSEIISLKALNLPSQFKNKCDLLLNAVEQNKNIYTQSLLILKNYKSDKIQDACDSLSKYIESTISLYKKSNCKDIEITIPSEIKSFPGPLKQFTLNEYSNYKSKEDLLKQYNDYFNTMNQLVQKFQSSLTNLNTNISMIQTKSESLDDLYGIIQKKTDTINSIITTYNSLSVPPKTTKQHQNFYDIVKSYLDYCLNFKDTLTTYKNTISKAGGADTSSFDSSFNSLNNTYNTIYQSFKNYLTLLNNDKEKYSDANNL